MKKFAIFVGIICCALCMFSCNDTNEGVGNQSSDIKVYGIESVGRSDALKEHSKHVFSGNNIEWFNSKTREIRFKGINPSSDVFPVYTKIEFRIDEKTLFTASTFVNDSYSQSFYDLVIYYDVEQGKYYLNDCYPDIYEIKNSEEVKRNIKDREAQWETFINTLKSENRIKE